MLKDETHCDFIPSVSLGLSATRIFKRGIER